MSGIYSYKRAIKNRLICGDNPRVFAKNWTSRENLRIKVPYHESFCNFILRKTLMGVLNSLNKFRKSAAGQVAAAVVAVPLAFSAAAVGAPNDAFAGDGQIRYVKYEPGDTVDFIERLGGEASHGRFSIVVFSDDDHVLRAAYEVAQDIERSTSYEVTYVHGPSIGPISRLLVMANGLKILDAQNGGGDIAGLKEDLRLGFERGSEQLAAAEGPQPSGSS